MAAMDLQALKAYVSEPVEPTHGEDTVLLHVSHSNLKQRFSEIRFDMHTTVERVKERLRTHTGTAVDSMVLQLFDDASCLVANMIDDARPLGYYSPLDGYRIHMLDSDPGSLSAGGWLEDTSLVKKYELSDEDYNKRQGDGCQEGHHVAARRVPSSNSSLVFLTQVGDRCEVDPGGKRGQVAYVGEVEGLAPGFWVGVCYDEPVGKHDGMVKGKRYFECPPNHGAVMRPVLVKVGDFPERDPFEEDEPDEI
eukprot:jgi/Mesen1/1737/ME000139S00976